MATVTFEQDRTTPQEVNLATAIQQTIAPLQLPDVRDAAPLIREMITQRGMAMVVGCGGSHIWIHRGVDFFPTFGEGLQALPERWAIITA